jgi:hypothetical protein
MDEIEKEVQRGENEEKCITIRRRRKEFQKC